MEHTDTLAALSDGMADAVENVAASVVRVNGRRRRSGSGVVFAQNKVLTASHVLEREEDLSVETADGRTLTARFAGRDPSTDLAVLNVEGLDIEPAMPAEGEARVGQISLAVGSHSRGEGPRATLGWLAPSGPGPHPAGTEAGTLHPDRRDAVPRILGRTTHRRAGERTWHPGLGLGTRRGVRHTCRPGLAYRGDALGEGLRQAGIPGHPEPAGAPPRRTAARPHAEGRTAGRRRGGR